MAKPKLPDFWAEAPDMWFVRAEAEFNLRSITLDTTKYGYLVAHLPENVALRVRDEGFSRCSPSPGRSVLRGCFLSHRLWMSAPPSSWTRCWLSSPLTSTAPALDSCLSSCSFGHWIQRPVHFWPAANTSPFVS